MQRNIVRLKLNIWRHTRISIIYSWKTNLIGLDVILLFTIILNYYNHINNKMVNICKNISQVKYIILLSYLILCISDIDNRYLWKKNLWEGWGRREVKGRGGGRTGEGQGERWRRDVKLTLLFLHPALHLHSCSLDTPRTVTSDQQSEEENKVFWFWFMPYFV